MRWTGGMGAVVLVVAAGASNWAAAAVVTVNGVPDWHQPGLIGAPNGPGGGAAGPYRDWCAPSAASDVMGYWSDIKGFNVADLAGYASGALIGWAPPNPANWQDNAADASSVLVNPPAAARGAGQDLGWYLNTNDMGDQGITIPAKGGGWSFTGTKRINEVPGLTDYLIARGYPQATVTQHASPVFNIAQGWTDIVTEINAGRPVLGEFDHFNILGPNGNLGGISEYSWGSPSSSDPQCGEIWDPSSGLGHMTTIVGYLAGNDANNPLPGINQIVVQDNRLYGAEALNQFGQILLPLDTVGGVAQSPWWGNVLVDVPEPASLVLLGLGGLMMLRRNRRSWKADQ